MKIIKCEMCESTDFAKVDGMWVCQHCGCKYSPEEAQKMMIEGTVKVDSSDFVQKSLMNARRARKKYDWAEVEKYYNLVEQHDPENIEAIFYSSYAKLRCALVEDQTAKWKEAYMVLGNSISILDDYFDTSKEDEQKQIIIDAVHDVQILSDVFRNGIPHGKQKVDGISSDSAVIARLADIYLFKRFIETLDNIMVKYKNENMDCSYIEPLKNSLGSANETAKKACYVATCVYGSYDCPEVWTLRRFRDYELAKTWYGRAFIKTYYTISPTIVKLFGETDWFKSMWHGTLDNMVKNLQEKGYESTPYDDLPW